MLIPLSWLKEFVDIKMPFPELATRLCEAGLTVETWKEVDNDILFDPEVTPNRPDWLSVYGVAREIAAVTNSKLKIPSSKQLLKPKSKLEITIKPNYNIVPRITSVIIKNVTVKPSPDWLQKRIKQIGLRPINNLVDITNYVLWEYGSLLHVFDYDKIRGHQMIVDQAKGGEEFRSLDGMDYKLPKGAIIIKDLGRVIDLLPLKGGENTASFNSTKNILVHSVIVDPVLTRRTSQALGLRSDSSSIAEKGLDPNGTMRAVLRASELILELAGGEVANEIIDHKAAEFKSWTVSVSHSRIEQVLGIKIPKSDVKNIFERLELKVEGDYKVTVPTFRNDIHIEEDLIEEVGRLYGYNNFPKTLPAAPVPTVPVAYAKNYDLEFEIKNTLAGFGYSEIYTYSLVSESHLLKLGIDPAKTLRIDNPISRDYEYLRPTLLGNLIESLKLNLPNFKDIQLFEFGKEYSGENLDKAKETTWLCGILTGEMFFEAKGIVEKILTQFGVNSKIISPETQYTWLHPGRQAIIENNLGFFGEVHPTLLSRFGIKAKATTWGINYALLEKLADRTKKFQQIPKFPAIIEDLSLIIPEKVLYGEVVDAIKKTSHLIVSVDLLDVHGESKTLRLTYLDLTKNLTDKDVAEVREKVLRNLKEIKVVLKV